MRKKIKSSICLVGRPPDRGKSAEPPGPSGLLTRLEEYSRRLYQEESDRSLGLNTASRNLFLILGASIGFLGAVVQWFLPNPPAQLPTFGSRLLTLLLVIAFALMAASFVLILLALRVRTFERLCDPIDFAGRSLLLESENELLAEIISNQLVASGRNYNVNETKARMLSRAYFCYLMGMVSILLAALVAVATNRGVL